MSKRKVVITGAAGYVAGRILPDLRDRYDLTLLDVKTSGRDGSDVEGVVIADLLDRNRDSYREHFRGADAVVHSGFTRSAKPEDRFWGELDNVAMAYNVYQTCLEEDVRRVVVISSNHAADYYERLIWDGKMGMVTPDMTPLSDNFYGWAKSAYELLGFAFAAGKIGDGKKLQNVHLRIGAPRETDMARCSPDDLKRMHRALGAYISVRDQVQLTIKSIETEDIEDEHGVPFQVFYGVSGNTHNFWSLANARDVIGYDPEDDSSITFADRVAEILLAAQKGRRTD
jgi:nucleoside-diphosphate-sugar epimerase